MQEKEFILCAAIKYKNTVICGRRHDDCYTILKKLLTPYIHPDDIILPGREDQGFITSTNRYVDRKEAFKIAKENNQIRYGLLASDNDSDSILISENLY